MQRLTVGDDQLGLSGRQSGQNTHLDNGAGDEGGGAGGGKSGQSEGEEELHCRGSSRVVVVVVVE